MKKLVSVVFLFWIDPFVRSITLSSPSAGEDKAKGRRTKRMQAEGMYDAQKALVRIVALSKVAYRTPRAFFSRGKSHFEFLVGGCP